MFALFESIKLRESVEAFSHKSRGLPMSGHDLTVVVLKGPSDNVPV